MPSSNKHKTTPRTEGLVVTLVELALEIDNSLLGFASVAARAEWTRLRGEWPTTADVTTGRVCLSDEELEHMIRKVVRFRAILVGLAAKLGVTVLAAA